MIRHLDDHILESIGEDIRTAQEHAKLEFVKEMSSALLRAPQGELFRQLMSDYCSKPEIYEKLGLNPDSEDFYTDARYGAAIAWTRYTPEEHRQANQRAA